MEYFPSHAGGDRAAFKGKTLVVPAVGHGNVGQLAVDLMIQTLVVDRLAPGASGASRLGCLDHPSVMPCVGTDAFAPIGGGDVGQRRAGATDEGGSQSFQKKVLATALELHGDERVCPGAVFLQLRCDVSVGASKKFANDLASFIESCAFAEVVIAASLPSTAQGAAAETVGDTRFRHARFFSDGDAKETFELATDDRWSRVDVPPIEPDSIPSHKTSSLPPWSLLRAVTRVSPNLDASCLVAVCSEGDNSDDAARAASALVRFLGISTAEDEDALQPERFLKKKLRDGWSVPSSWLGAYGRRAAESR